MWFFKKPDKKEASELENNNATTVKEDNKKAGFFSFFRPAEKTVIEEPPAESEATEPSDSLPPVIKPEAAIEPEIAIMEQEPPAPIFLSQEFQPSAETEEVPAALISFVQPPVEPEPQVELPQDEEPEKINFFERLKQGLKKTRDNFVSGLTQLIPGRSELTPEFWDELEELLILSDAGTSATEKVLAELKQRAKAEKIKTTEQAVTAIKEIISGILNTGDNQLKFDEDEVTVFLVVGVNGTGKTTSIAKLAHNLKHQGRNLILSAADTFRAAAIDQLEIWGERTGIPVVKQNPGADPAAVVFDSIKAAKARGNDLVIADTAGRLHSKAPLMEELKKIKRVLQKELPNAPQEVLLVLDATTGQNALIQAKTFKEAVDLTGIILTKLDGTAKGGIILAIAEELKVPVKYIGIGEKITDLLEFKPEEFVEALFSAKNGESN